MKKSILVLLFVSFLPLIDLFHPGLPITHDGQDHVARIANFYQSLSEGNIVPRWAGNLNWGYGHPILMFLYPLPSYVGAFFHAIGFSFVDSTKLVFAAAYVASILAMYLWAGAAWGRMPGFVAAVLYGFAPYRFVDIYVRGAIGEHMAFVFLPIVLWGITKNSISIISLGTAALILSHNALSIMFLPIIILYALYARKLKLIPFVGLGFLLSAFFWIPAFVEGKYTLREIVTTGQFGGRYVQFWNFFYAPWSYGGSDTLSKFLGWAQLVVIIFACIKFKKQRIFIGGVLLILLASLLIMTPWSDVVWQNVTLLQKFQFPWRFLSVSVFALAALGGVVMSVIKKRKNIFVLVISTIAVLGTLQMWHAQAYKQFPESFFTGIYHGTTDTGESSPIWSVRFMEKEASDRILVISGDATIKSIKRTSTKHEYQILAVSQTKLVENTLYFPGWNVYIDNILAPVEFQNPQYRGLMTFDVPQGQHTIELIFTDTKLRKTSNILSIVGLVLVLGIMLVWRKKK